MKTSKIMILAGLLAFSCSAALAADPKPKVPDFKKADVNGDKVIDEAEFAPATAAGVKKTFADLDKDKDGKLSRKEYSVILSEDCE